MNPLDLRFFKKNGYLVKKNLLNKKIIINLNNQKYLKHLHFLNLLL